MNNKKNSPQDSDIMAPGTVKPLAEIEIGPTKHEKFLDQNYKKMIFAVIGVVLVMSAFIIYFVVQDETNREAGEGLVAAIYNPNGYDVDALARIEQDYSGRNAAITADYFQAMALIKEGKSDDGKSALAVFINKVEDPEWKAQASAVLGSYYLQDGNQELATKYFESAVAQNSNIYSPFALISLGDIARQNNEQEKAADYYNQAESRYSNSVQVSSFIEERLNLLGVSAPERVIAPVSIEPAQGPKPGVLPEVFALPGGVTDSAE